jgi:cellulase
MVNIHSAVSKYVAPGPAVIAGGTTVTPGAAVCSKAAAKMVRGMNDMFSQ